MYLIKFTLPLLLLAFASAAIGGGNTTNQLFNKAKKMLERQMYSDHRVTLYCVAEFDAKKNILVPAQNIGRSFSEWNDGHKNGVDSKGNNFKGRKYAEKMNTEYRNMQSDFGNGDMRIDNKKAQPPIAARGRIDLYLHVYG